MALARSPLPRLAAAVVTDSYGAVDRSERPIIVKSRRGRAAHAALAKARATRQRVVVYPRRMLRLRVDGAYPERPTLRDAKIIHPPVARDEADGTEAGHADER